MPNENVKRNIKNKIEIIKKKKNIKSDLYTNIFDSATFRMGSIWKDD